MIAGKELRIITLLLIDTCFFLLELIIGYMSHSLALIADSFHMLNDIFSLLVALWAVNVAKNRSPDAKYTYGWKRAEILGALINAVFLIALCVSILIEALQRLLEPQEIKNPKLVLIVGTAGLISNIVGLFLFHDHGHGGHSHSHGGETEHDLESHSHTHVSASESSMDINDSNISDIMPGRVLERIDEHTSLVGKDKKKNKKKSTKSLNMHGVFLHVLGDALGNVGVISAALFIWKTDYSWRFYSDPIVSLVITVIIFSSALPLSRRASRILLQATPSTISADEIQREILAVPGVIAVHDFHIWNLTESIFIASIHVKIECTPDQYINSAKLIRNIFHEYGIHSATVQPEFTSDNVSSDIQRRFSRIAGGRDEFSSSNSPPEIANLPNQERPAPSAYGATTSDTNCLIDDAVNCNADNCLAK